MKNKIDAVNLFNINTCDVSDEREFRTIRLTRPYLIMNRYSI